MTEQTEQEEDKILKSFTVHVPVELVKSETGEDDEAEDSWKIQGIASTKDKDLQGEEVDQEGLDISVLKEGRGLFNNDHLKGPENILGQIDDAEFVEDSNKNPALMVKGYLFKQQPRAQAYYNIMKSVRKGAPSRVHFSIEGKVVERDMVNSGKIKKARVDKVALTLDPVNPCTFAELMKSMAASDYSQPEAPESQMGKEEYPVASKPDSTMYPRDHEKMAEKMKEQQKALQEELFKAIQEAVDKAISAGAGHADAPGSRTGGSALQKESLDSKVKNMSYKKLKKDKNAQAYMLKSLIETVSGHYEDQDPLELARMICKSYELKLKEFLDADGRDEEIN